MATRRDEAKGEPGKEEVKIAAKAFVKNLYEAYLEGLLRAKRDADESDVVTILVMLSDSWPSRGETERSNIASDVMEAQRRRQGKNVLAWLPRRGSSIVDCYRHWL